MKCGGFAVARPNASVTDVSKDESTNLLTARVPPGVLRPDASISMELAALAPPRVTPVGGSSWLHAAHATRVRGPRMARRAKRMVAVLSGYWVPPPDGVKVKPNIRRMLWIMLGLAQPTPSGLSSGKSVF